MFSDEPGEIYNNSTLKGAVLNLHWFKVYGENCKFHWLVHGKRCNVEVEPDKNSVIVKGNGPYKWI
jgi:hypothetical protein